MAAAQMNLWNDVRLPDAFHEHYLKTGHCLNCLMPLNHPLHAFNHYAKYHTTKPKAVKSKRAKVVPTAPQRQEFYVWRPGIGWGAPVVLGAFLYAQTQGICTAATKERK